MRLRITLRGEVFKTLCMEKLAAQAPNIKQPSKYPTSRNPTSHPPAQKSRPNRRPQATSSPLPQVQNFQNFQINPEISQTWWNLPNFMNLPELQIFQICNLISRLPFFPFAYFFCIWIFFHFSPFLAFSYVFSHMRHLASPLHVRAFRYFLFVINH